MAGMSQLEAATGHEDGVRPVFGVPRDLAAEKLLGLRVDPALGRGEVLVVPQLLNSIGALWGGVGLAAAIGLCEEVLGRRALWASVQYISPIRCGERLELSLHAGRRGRGLTQAAVRGTVEGRQTLLVTGTFGGRAGNGPTADLADDFGRDLQLATAPVGVRTPAQCPEYTVRPELPGSAAGLLERVEQRWATPTTPELAGTPGNARTMLWLRSRVPLPLSAVVLAVLADFAPVAIGHARGVPTYGVSLDNSIRLAHISPDPGAGDDSSSPWILLDVRVEALVRGVAQLYARMFGEDGRLLATAGQSTLMRHA
ncbi:acyl-CoA thioesterase domain-containing protein [Frankia sp. CcI49]|uniref:acyl-CoA thioesterase domain-containing protein n=1 Tax=Frankia sp. CcI49 TaxID=1745382 RepID=UPI000A061A8B|nr:acyl-CoA thioesterase domain-containing protein [Frankia sp. CcI49]